MTPTTFASGTVTNAIGTLTTFAAASQARAVFYNGGAGTLTLGVHVTPSGGTIRQVASFTVLPGESAWWPTALARADFGIGDKLVASVNGSSMNFVVEGLS